MGAWGPTAQQHIVNDGGITYATATESEGEIYKKSINNFITLTIINITIITRVIIRFLLPLTLLLLSLLSIFKKIYIRENICT